MREALITHPMICLHPKAVCVSDNSEGRTYWCPECGAIQPNSDSWEPDPAEWVEPRSEQAIEWATQYSPKSTNEKPA